MSRLESLGEFLAEQRRSARLTLRQLADATGISNPYLSQIERGLRKPSAEVLQQLARGLRISAETLYTRAGILDPDEPHDPHHRSVEQAVLADPVLSERQKRVLLDVYQSLRHEAESSAGHAAAPDAAPDTGPDAAPDTGPDAAPGAGAGPSPDWGGQHRGDGVPSGQLGQAAPQADQRQDSAPSALGEPASPTEPGQESR